MLIDRQLVFTSDAQGLIELAANLEDVCDVSHRHCLLSQFAESFVDRQYVFAMDSQGLVEFTVDGEEQLSAGADQRGQRLHPGPASRSASRHPYISSGQLEQPLRVPAVDLVL